MTRKKATHREPTPREEGQQVLESAEKAGADYAREQLGGDYFRDWIYEQMLEAERMRQADPDSVFPTDTPSGARKAARNMLQQLEWDTKRDMDASTVLELSGAKGVFGSGSADWVRDTYGITYEDVIGAFFGAFTEELKSTDVRQWLADLILEMGEEVRGGGEASESPRAHRIAEKDVMILTHDGAWKLERVPARVGMIVRVYLGSDRNGQPRSGADDYVITRVDPKHNRIATKLAHYAGSETWGDASGYLAMKPHPRAAKRARVSSSRHRPTVRDYIAVDPSGRTVAGPFADYGEAKREADRARGYVRFASKVHEAPRGPSTRSRRLQRPRRPTR